MSTTDWIFTGVMLLMLVFIIWRIICDVRSGEETGYD